MKRDELVYKVIANTDLGPREAEEVIDIVLDYLIDTIETNMKK